MSLATKAKKDAARKAVMDAMRSGRLPVPTRCESCGSDRLFWPSIKRRRIQWHHHDYSKPLDVIALCHCCHFDVHSGIKAEPRTGRWYVKTRLDDRRRFAWLCDRYALGSARVYRTKVHLTAAALPTWAKSAVPQRCVPFVRPALSSAA